MSLPSMLWAHAKVNTSPQARLSRQNCQMAPQGPEARASPGSRSSEGSLAEESGGSERGPETGRNRRKGSGIGKAERALLALKVIFYSLGT